MEPRSARVVAGRVVGLRGGTAARCKRVPSTVYRTRRLTAAARHGQTCKQTSKYVQQKLSSEISLPTLLGIVLASQAVGIWSVGCFSLGSYTCPTQGITTLQ